MSRESILIENITIKKGDEKVRVIAVANSRLITEINIKIFDPLINYPKDACIYWWYF